MPFGPKTSGKGVDRGRASIRFEWDRGLVLIYNSHNIDIERICLSWYKTKNELLYSIIE